MGPGCSGGEHPLRWLHPHQSCDSVSIVYVGRVHRGSPTLPPQIFPEGWCMLVVILLLLVSLDFVAKVTSFVWLAKQIHLVAVLVPDNVHVHEGGCGYAHVPLSL